MGKYNLIPISAALQLASKSNRELRLAFLKLSSRLIGENPLMMELHNAVQPEYSIKAQIDQEIRELEKV